MAERGVKQGDWEFNLAPDLTYNSTTTTYIHPTTTTTPTNSPTTYIHTISNSFTHPINNNASSSATSSAINNNTTTSTTTTTYTTVSQKLFMPSAFSIFYPLGSITIIRYIHTYIFIHLLLFLH